MLESMRQKQAGINNLASGNKIARHEAKEQDEKASISVTSGSWAKQEPSSRGRGIFERRVGDRLKGRIHCRDLRKGWGPTGWDKTSINAGEATKKKKRFRSRGGRVSADPPKRKGGIKNAGCPDRSLVELH